MLRAERTMLNLLCRLSGVDAETRRWSMPSTHVPRCARREDPAGDRQLQKRRAPRGGSEPSDGSRDAALKGQRCRGCRRGGGRGARRSAGRSRRPLEVECDDVNRGPGGAGGGGTTILLDTCRSTSCAVPYARPVRTTTWCSRRAGLTWTPRATWHRTVSPSRGWRADPLCGCARPWPRYPRLPVRFFPFTVRLFAFTVRLSGLPRLAVPVDPSGCSRGPKEVPLDGKKLAADGRRGQKLIK